MSTTKIYSDLFKNEGGGDQLKNEVIPLATSIDDKSSNVASTQWVREWFNSMSSDTDIYIDAANGNDSNPGTSTLPLKTIEASRLLLTTPEYPASAYTIHIRAGDYSTEYLYGIRGKDIEFTTEGGTVKVSRLYGQGSSASIAITGTYEFKVPSSNTALAVTRGCSLLLRDGLNITFSGTSIGYIMSAALGAIISCGNSASISLKCSSVTGTCNIRCVTNSVISFSGATTTWSGSFTGKRYQVDINSSLTGVGGANVIPGTTAGTADSSSYFS